VPVAEQLLAACVAVTDTPVADATDPDQPLIWVNAAFETVSGYPGAHVLGRNARLLQGPDTDPTAVAGLAAAPRAGLLGRTRLHNYRPDGSSWWNEIHLSPLRDPPAP